MLAALMVEMLESLLVVLTVHTKAATMGLIWADLKVCMMVDLMVD